MTAVCRSFTSSTLNRGRGEYPLLPIITPSHAPPPYQPHLNGVTTSVSALSAPPPAVRSDWTGQARVRLSARLAAAAMPAQVRQARTTELRRRGAAAWRRRHSSACALCTVHAAAGIPNHRRRARMLRRGRTGPNRRDVAQACAYGRATARVRALARSRWASLLWALDLACVGVRTRSSARER